MSIPLPPLPDYGDIANSLGASLAMQLCVTKSKDGAYVEVPHRDLVAMLRARDQKIVRVVLEVVKSACEAEKAKWPFESACTVAIQHCISGILELEFKHHE